MLLLLFFPFFETSRVASIVFILLYTTALLSGVYAISYDVRYIAVGMLLVSPIIICHWSNIVLGSPALDILERVCTALFIVVHALCPARAGVQGAPGGSERNLRFDLRLYPDRDGLRFFLPAYRGRGARIFPFHLWAELD